MLQCLVFCKKRGIVFVFVLAFPLVHCSSRTIEPDVVCVQARVLLELEQEPCLITPSGLTVFATGAALTLRQLELDGTLTEVMTLPVDGWCHDFAFEHDVASGRMWVLEGHDRDTETPAQLRQFDASGQVEWARELSQGDRPVARGSLLHHQDALYVAMTLDWVIPPDPTDYENYLAPTLVIERRDPSGELVWTRGDYPTPDGSSNFASAGLVNLNEAGLSMVATPPLIDYGPSYPFTIDGENGDVVWSGGEGRENGHDGLWMVGDDQQLYLAWTLDPRIDPTKLPERVEIESGRSYLEVMTPTGLERAFSEVHWSDWNDTNVRLATMGEQILSLVDGVPGLGVAVHDKTGELACKGTLELPEGVQVDQFYGRPVEIEGRDQVVVGGRRRVGDPEDYAYESMLLLIEALDD